VDENGGFVFHEGDDVTVDKYKLEKQIGSGRFAKVFSAFDNSGFMVAIKIYHTKFTNIGEQVTSK
jgi:serine/threonine-protein kinase RIO1